MLVDPSADAECTEALLDIDEAVACLERSEEQLHIAPSLHIAPLRGGYMSIVMNLQERF